MITSALSSKERLTKILNRETVDRPPIWLLFPYHRFGSYVDIYNIPCYGRVIEAASRMADVFDRRHVDRGFCCTKTPEIEYSSERVAEDGQIIDRRTIKWNGTVLTHETSRGPKGTFIKPYVTDIEQLDEILEMPYLPPRPDVSRFFEEEKELGDKGLMMMDAGDALGFLYGLCSVEDFAVWSLLERDALIRFTDEMHRRMMDLYTYLLDKGIGPTYFLVGSEFAGPPVVSPAYFDELSGKYVKDLVDLIRSYGMKSIVHYHGNLYKVLPAMKRINPDAIHTIEAPPIGDCTLTQAREALGDDIILIGNIQYDDLRRLPEDEIRRMVRGCMEETRGRGFILSPTAGPYETEIDERMQNNYIAFMEAGVEYGKKILGS